MHPLCLSSPAKFSQPGALLCGDPKISLSDQQASSLRRREVILSRISIYIAFVFLFCHSVRVVPNAYELVTTYTKVCSLLLITCLPIGLNHSIHFLEGRLINDIRTQGDMGYRKSKPYISGRHFRTHFVDRIKLSDRLSYARLPT